MGFEDREKSVYSGEPVECFHFSRGTLQWYLTSADRPVVLPGIGTFTPAELRASGQDFREEDHKAKIQVELPRNSEIVTPYIAAPPSLRTWLRVYRAHRGDEADPVCWFFGWIDQAPVRGSVAVCQCPSIMSAFSKRLPGLAYTVKCNRALYSPECGVSAAAFRESVTVAGLSGANVTSPQFALHADGYFTAGYLERENGDRRFIVGHTGDTVQLMSPFTGLAAAEVVSALPGCDLTHTACMEKFANANSFWGFEFMPLRNPHTQQVT